MANKQIKQQFGLKIQTLRRQRSMTQEQLSAKIDRSIDTISNIERGFSSTRIETAGSLAKALGVTLPELFDFGPGVADKGRAHRRLLEDLTRILQPYDDDTIRTITKMIESALAVRTRKPSKK